MKFFTQPYPIPMPEGAWRLLKMYMVVLRFRQVKRRERQVNTSKLIGGIIAWYVLAHERWIRNEWAKVRAELVRTGPHPRFFSLEDLDRIETATAAEVSKPMGAGWRSANGTRPPEERRALPTIDRGAPLVVPVFVGQPGDVRAGGE
jgi:hypothetical protein